MRILGIDPGYATIGFGLITAERAQVNMLTYGAITTPAGLPPSRRLYQIGTCLLYTSWALPATSSRAWPGAWTSSTA